MEPTLNKLSTYQDQYPYVPVIVKRPVDDFDPVTLAKLVHQAGNGFALTVTHQQRYSYFSLNVERSLTSRAGQLKVDHQLIKTDPTTCVQQLLHDYQTPRIAGLPPFTGGLMGYFGYEYVQMFEHKLQFHAANPDRLNDLGLMLVTSVIVYDHLHHELGLTKLLPTAQLPVAYARAQKELPRRLDNLIAHLQQLRAEALPPLMLTTALTMHQSSQVYQQQVERIRRHIYAGDVFQLIYANPQSARMQGSLLRVYQQLGRQNPSPYEFYFRQDDLEVAAASPETLVTKQAEQIATYPLAGTRRRGRRPVEDQRLAHELTTSQKEIAEHNMLVDLGRNDLGRVAKFKTVRVTNLRRLIKFSQVMHLGSRVAAEVAPTTTAMDVLAATFPAGTLSGAPKVEAMTLIDHYEQRQRGIYGGCFGYLDANGNLDMAIGIRLAYQQNGALVIPAGAGIVADSIGSQEFQECQNKARAVVQAVQTAEVTSRAIAN